MNKHYPWLIASIACIALLVSNGMGISGLSVFDESLIKEFGWSRGELKFRDMVTFATSALLAPFGGMIIDKIGAKRALLMGWVLLATAYFSYSQIDSLQGLYVVHALLGLVLILCGLNPAVILVSNWFTSKRGAAIGITLVGTSLGGVLFPQYGLYMNELFGWRETMQWAVAFPLTMLIVVAVLVKDRPSQMKQKANQTAEQSKPQPLTGMSYIDALRTRTFWALTLVAMTTFYTVLGVQAHLFLYMRDLGFETSTAANAISLFFMCALIGKFVFGFVADHIHFKKVFIGNIAIMLTGSLLLALMNKAVLWEAIVLFGLGWGGVYTTIQLSAVNCFGLKSAGKILGTITVLDCLGGGLGIWLTGVFYGMNSSYDLAFWVFFGLILIAIPCITQVKETAYTKLSKTAA
ncbi:MULTISPECIES: MFS transporter [Aliiglaciecola]|uniref:MFS transporter n=1 Tax=Aliiglaciecola TaxID=1406885 RepID=UPI001C097B2E|nr:MULTISPECIES: MFS transporter [Aliiglaciecola]MBU2879036.1 MFS transporter [Aliiglaciecola lipolytica]MDO6710734.1 MFS transporter [Aliiglaciecola sp. 2_MG-2023]MDO6751858.1 MFS transporter [Aliiglaciecola sp. 1_MG-2023]